MPCRCAERGLALRQARDAAAQRQYAAMLRKLGYVARTGVQDLRQAAQWRPQRAPDRRQRH